MTITEPTTMVTDYILALLCVAFAWRLGCTSGLWMSAFGVILRTTFDEYQGTLSPDGRFLAYVSEETGIPQVYAQSFPGGEHRVQVSSEGGSEPRW